jgi:hypothetical protein
MASELDGAGQIKMATLAEASGQVQRLHGLVEQAALTVKNGKPIQAFGAQFRRAATPLAGLLKPQFGSIADLITGMILVSTRGGGDQAKIRAMREGIGQLKVQLDIATTQVKAKHTAHKPGDDAH